MANSRSLFQRSLIFMFAILICVSMIPSVFAVSLSNYTYQFFISEDGSSTTCSFGSGYSTTYDLAKFYLYVDDVSEQLTYRYFYENQDFSLILDSQYVDTQFSIAFMLPDGTYDYTNIVNDYYIEINWDYLVSLGWDYNYSTIDNQFTLRVTSNSASGNVVKVTASYYSDSLAFQLGSNDDTNLLGTIRYVLQGLLIMGTSVVGFITSNPLIFVTCVVVFVCVVVAFARRFLKGV